MTKLDLILKLTNVPNDAEIFLYTDHSQVSVSAGVVEITSQDNVKGIYQDNDEEIIWNGNPKLITGVRIS